MPSQSFTKAQRVRRRGEFQHVFNRASRVASRYFTLLLTTGTTSTTRLGIVASKKIGDAVHRNRGKRLIRELFRRHHPLPDGGVDVVDVVVIPRRDVFDASYADLDRDFRAAWRRAVARLPRPSSDAC